MCRDRAFGLVLGGLFVALAVLGRDARAWPQYGRLAALLLALVALLPVGRRLAWEAVGAPLGAALLMAAAVQLGAPTAGAWSAVLWVGMVGLAWWWPVGCTAWSASAAPGAPSASGAYRRRAWPPVPGVPGQLEWTVLGVGLIVLVVSLAAATLPGMPRLWPGSLQWVIYPWLWLGLVRVLALAAPAARRGLVVPAVVVVAVVCLTGGVRLVHTLYQLHSARSAVAAGAPQAAAIFYRQARDGAADLGLTWVREEARLGLATSLMAAGARPDAEAVLGLRLGQAVTIAPDQWEGPVGGHLFKNASCWRDVWLWAGTVDVEIRARGRAARGHWPRLRVRLGARELGEMEVASAQEVAHTFTTRVPTGKQRLRVELVAGFWSSRGEHRWARLDTVSIRYLEGAP